MMCPRSSTSSTKGAGVWTSLMRVGPPQKSRHGLLDDALEQAGRVVARLECDAVFQRPGVAPGPLHLRRDRHLALEDLVISVLVLDELPLRVGDLRFRLL